MVEAFATVDDLGTRMQRTFSDDEEAWIESLLADASAYLRWDVLGIQVYPPAQSTVTFWPDGGRVDLPSTLLVSVDAVQRDLVDVVYTRREATIWVDCDDPVEVTFTAGLANPPESLLRWTCVLVSQVLLTLEQQLGLTAGGLSSVAVDDFKAAYADAGDSSGITLSDRNIALIRAQYGVRGSTVVSTR